MDELYVVSAMLSYSCSDAIMRVLMNTYNIYTSNTIRAIIRLVLVLPSIRSIRLYNIKLHLVYWILSLMRTYCFMYAIKHVEIPTIAIINYSCSIFTLIMFSILSNSTTRKQYISVLMCIISLYVGLQPKFEANSIDLLITMLGGLVTSMDKFLVHKLLITNSITTMTVASNLFMIVSSISVMSIEIPNMKDLCVFVVAGILGLSGQILSTKALKNGNHSKLAPYYYSIFIFGISIEFILYGFIPSIRVVFAIVMILIAIFISK